MFFKNMLSRELICILSLSVCFMFLFAADFSMVNIQKTVVSSITDEAVAEGRHFDVEGYTVTGIVYTIFAISLWFGPYINYALGPRLTMVLSAVGYLIYVGSYAVETEWAIYGGAVVDGIAAGTLWTAQGHYMILNSSPQTTARNAAIFWFIYMNSNMLGNIFVFFKFQGKKYLDQMTRRTTIYGLMAVNVVAIVAFMALPKSASGQKAAVDYGPVKTMKNSWNLLISAKMLWLTVAFSYAGLQQAFWNGIYSPSIGFTTSFGDSKELVALSGIFMSIGAVFGALCPIIFSGWIRSSRIARRGIFLLGVIAQLFTYLIAYLNLPNEAVFGNTDKTSLIPPSIPLAMLGSLLLCFGDSCLTTQIYSIIGDFYRDNSAEACALYKFMKGVFVAVSFYWCSHLGLHVQLIIMAAGALIGSFCFCVADHDSPPHQKPLKQSAEI